MEPVLTDCPAPPSPSPPPAYVCALQKEVPYHGRLYITDTNACFHSSVLLKETKVGRFLQLPSIVENLENISSGDLGAGLP